MGHKRKSLQCSNFSLFYLFDDLVVGRTTGPGPDDPD
jgi:hypothetical protein